MSRRVTNDILYVTQDTRFDECSGKEMTPVNPIDHLKLPALADHSKRADTATIRVNEQAGC